MEEELTQEDGSQRRHSLAPTIEDFEILKPISRGAFGKVFLCHRKNHPERKLAVKVMNKGIMSQKNMKDQVIAERNAAAIAKSDFCVGLLYSLQTTDNVFLVMEYMIGGDLKSLLGNYGFFPEHQAVFYLAECVLALQDLHRRGIVHRDIKPDNMLLSAQGHLKLTDFGLSTTGLQDRELQVTDLVGRTPWNQRHAERLVRTPGQILSLTSHLSFSNTPVMQDDSGSVSGSFVRSSALLGSRSTSFTSSHVSANTPTKAPASSLMSRRIVRKGSFQEAMAIHSKEQEQLAMEHESPSSPLRENPSTPNSSFRLQELPNSSLDMSYNKTMDFDACVVSPPRQRREELETVLEENKNTSSEGKSSSFLENELTPPPLELEDNDSLGSISSSPKNSAKLLHQSFLEENINISPVSVAASPQSSPPPRQMSAPGCSPSSPDTDRINPISTELQANSRIRSIRQHSGDASPEKLIMEGGNSFEEENGSIDIMECRGDELDQKHYSKIFEKKPKLSITSQFAASTSSSSSSRGFKAPISIQAKRKASCITASASSFTSGLTDDLTDLQLIKRKKGQMEEDILSEQGEDQILASSSSSTKSSSTSSEEDQGPGQGYSTPVPLSAVPRHLKGLKTVKFVSPAGVTPVQNHLSQPIVPLSLAQFDRLDRSFPSSSQSFQSPLPSTPFRTPKSVGRRGSTVKGQSASRLLGTPDYLAPELLLSKGHSMAVDWWALGVCLYEFLVGIPPFTDSTPDAVFDNILSRRLEWPEGEESLSNAAVSAILALLEVNPANRADGPTVRAMLLTKDVNWDNILNMQAPFIPNPDHASDTTYFDARNSMQGLMVSAVDL